MWHSPSSNFSTTSAFNDSSKKSLVPLVTFLAPLIKHSQISFSNCFNNNNSMCPLVSCLTPNKRAGITLELFLTKTSPGFNISIIS